ncbi:MAG TPA: helix-turn-helix transcriptional regulator [Candidatus Limnocylindrales bacterium]
MAHISRGVAYPFWVRVEDERAAKGWNKAELAERVRLPRSTIDNLKTGSRAPQPRIVNALADALDIDRSEAHQLAGIVPTKADQSADVRRAIETSTAYTETQKQMLLETVDALDAINAAQRRPGTEAS